MGKGVFLSLGIVGTGSLGIGGLVVFKPWQTNTSKESRVTTSIKEKYSIALLNLKGDETIWTKKYEILKTSSPHNSILKEALKRSKDPNKDEKRAQELLREGCEAIYSTSIENSKSLSDFKTFCSKTNADASRTENWNLEENVSASDNKWDKALSKLNKHDVSTNGELDTLLLTLKQEIKTSSVTTTFESTKRTKIKEWCSAVKIEVFGGENSTKFKNQEDFCKIID